MKMEGGVSVAMFFLLQFHSILAMEMKCNVKELDHFKGLVQAFQGCKADLPCTKEDYCSCCNRITSSSPTKDSNCCSIFHGLVLYAKWCNAPLIHTSDEKQPEEITDHIQSVTDLDTALVICIGSYRSNKDKTCECTWNGCMIYLLFTTCLTILVTIEVAECLMQKRERVKTGYKCALLMATVLVTATLYLTVK